MALEAAAVVVEVGGVAALLDQDGVGQGYRVAEGGLHQRALTAVAVAE